MDFKQAVTLAMLSFPALSYANQCEISLPPELLNPRSHVQETAQRECALYPFGCSLDDILLSAEEGKVDVSKPYNRLREEEWTIHIDRKSRELRLYVGDEEASLISESKVIVGGPSKDHSTGKVRGFKTPSGIFYITRVVKDPYWYPPSWSEYHGRTFKPGPGNPFGKVMMELCTEPVRANYDFNPPHSSFIKLHSTNRKWNDKDVSHGCIRIVPEDVEEIGQALIYYLSDGISKSTGRGNIYILERPVTVIIE